MSGTCLSKKGNRYSCDQCERKGLKPDFDFCPYCGEEIIMRWDGDNDCKLGDAPQPGVSNG
jgi:predicted RNA-binding Zn-ribbon protein involved in translation (DUF1610 family)